MIIFWVLMHSNIASECNSTHQLFQRIILYWIHACSTQCVLHMPPFSFWWNTIFSSWHQTPDYSCTLTNVVLPMLANGGLCGFSLNSYVTSVLLTHICHCGNVYIYPVIIFNNRYRPRIFTEAVYTQTCIVKKFWCTELFTIACNCVHFHDVSF